ncbi:UNVERIFIED_CONTAM: pyruvate,water dikinase [Acetivibrio alkalicellulosi]
MKTKSNNLYVIPLKKLKPVHHLSVGGKAKNLAQLLKKGLPVPSGFCITTYAYEEFINSIPLISDAFIRLEAIPSDNVEAIINEVSIIRNLLIASPIPLNLEKAILLSMNTIGEEGYYAVRSSATTEDLDGASFAGQQDTYLNVKGKTEILKSIKSCWVSLFNDRAVFYRIHKKINHKEALMAVVVQKMVDAELSGVIFTANPLSGIKDQMVIEYTEGLGEALVSGRVTPHRAIVSKDNLSIIEWSKGTESQREVKLLKKLSYLAKKIEVSFGCSQDIEWATKNGKPFILQARPITTLSLEKDQTVWSNVNVGEIMPYVITPLCYSYFQHISKAIFKPFLRLLGVNLDKRLMFGSIAGRVYVNLSLFDKMIKNAPGPIKMNLSEVFGGVPTNISESNDKKHLFRQALTSLALIVSFPFLLVVFLFISRKNNIDGLLNTMRSRSARLMYNNYESLNINDLTDRLYWYVIWKKKIFTAGVGVSSGMGYTTAFLKICKKWLNDDSNKVGNILLACVGNMASADAGRDLIFFASWIEKNEDLKKIVLESKNFETLKKDLSAINIKKEFIDRWDNFMELHGHHARGEVDLFIPRWWEQPDYILDMLKGYLGKSEDFISQQNQNKKSRDDVYKSVIKQLKNPIKPVIFNFFLNKARRGLSTRENYKSEVVRLLSIARKSLYEIERRFINQGILREKDDIFFITIEELNILLKGEFVKGIDELIALRRQEFMENQNITPPPVVIGKYDPQKAAPSSFSNVTSCLKGISVSSGISRGFARVITDCHCEAKLLPGEILVAPFTDPGWTPYFLNAAGIVMDMGGMLSHGSIVAREYGIPAVVNVGPATKYIKNGQMIEVDGDSGVVRIM